MKFILNGTSVTPDNVFELSLNSDFTGRPTTAEVGADKLVFKREAVNPVIQSWLTAYSPLHGIPLQIITNSGQTLEYYVDLMDGAKYNSYSVEVSIKRRKGKDNFFDNANGTSFELMLKKGVQFSFVNIPYIIVKDNAVELAISLGISIYVLTKELIEQIKQLTIAITELTDITFVGVGFPLGLLLGSIVKAVLQLAIVALLVVAVIKMAEEFFELIFPSIREFKACKVKELITKGCQYLGYTVQSSLLNTISNGTILPVPLVKKKKSFFDFLQNDLDFAYTKGVPTGQDTTPTLGSLITAIENKYNAKTTVVNGVVKIERRDFFQLIATKQMLPALALQDSRQDSYSFNTQDVWKRTYISYRTDPNDLNTMDFFDPTDAEYSTEPTSIPNTDLVLIKGLNEVANPWALGVRKGELNWIENFAKGFFEIVDEVTGVFGSGTNYASTIANRIGVLQISSQFYTVTKFLWTVAGKQPSNYVNFVSASSDYNNYHVINQINNNDFKVFEDVPTRMNDEEYVSLLNNNWAFIDGLASEILQIQYFDEESTAIISYKVPNDWASGKTTVLTINS